MGRKRRTLAIGFAAFATVVFVCLGVWQLQRREWKLDLIARVDARLAAAPVAAPGPDGWAGITADGDAYRRVTATGTYETGHDTLVQAVTELGPGSWVLTPLATAEGFTVLVNRGFAPPDRRTPADIAPPEGPVTVTGLLRVTEPGGAFLRSNDPDAGRWYSRDTAAIATAGGLGAVAPYFIDADADAPGEVPVGGLTVVQFRNSHLVYALTWFALALTSIAITALGLRRERGPSEAGRSGTARSESGRGDTKRVAVGG
ncbi:SURF1 family protein [Acuticoccus sediminis]|uniref:SURF1 family protein n=1 Tax=Acuticoccus sediminis TaxID=2184697 RepID=UPI001B3BED5A|nr:SURF1 family protein [Acuticoccus sediminis]